MKDSQFALNPDAAQTAAIIAQSEHRAARALVCERTGQRWVWPFEVATHREAAESVGALYSRPPGDGDVLVS